LSVISPDHCDREPTRIRWDKPAGTSGVPLGQGGSRMPTASRPTGLVLGRSQPLYPFSLNGGSPVSPRGFLARLVGESGSR
jgi:hypothetical protein